MHFTGEITLGNLAIIITLIGIAIRFGVRLGSFQTTLAAHATALEGHSLRLDRHETQIIRLISSLQRLIGRSEIHVREEDLDVAGD